MFPHEDVADGPYERVIQKLDERAARDQTLALLLSDGFKALNRKIENQWIGLSEERRIEVLKGVEQTPFFAVLRADFVTWFYSNPEVWSHFGYEGSSNDKGGYVHRGFNDIDWIERAEG
ncbi:MAG: hypothetical protein C5B58_14240 [Acidobacteria bacterium]|nr:MAG: hypothetical protein C5B58_14240 [Acidobacteriota bacterium]